MIRWAFVMGLMGCASTATWSDRPPRLVGELPAAVDGDSRVLDALRASDAESSAKFYWHDRPRWRVQASLGVATGRRTENAPIIEARRHDGSVEGIDDLCTVTEIDVEQRRDARGHFVGGAVHAHGSESEIDCAVYESLD